MSHDPVEDLRQEIAKGHVLVVVGSGVSVGATNGNPLASWTGLLKDGVERCVKVKGLDAKWANRVREEIESKDMDDFLFAAERISRKLGFPDGGEYRRWLRETVGGLRAEDRSVLEALRDLGLPLATTNYDGLLEEITGLPPVTWRDGDKVARAIRQDEPGILHLHGYWDQPESVVLGLRSYERILGHGHAQAVLRAVQTLHTLLFVGCGDGLADPNFGALLEWAREVFQVSEARHYRLCLDGEIEDLRKRHKDDRLHPIPYGSEHSTLAQFLRDLKAPVAPREFAQRMEHAEAEIQRFATTHNLPNGTVTKASSSPFGTVAFKMRLPDEKGVIYYHASGQLCGRVFYNRDGIGWYYEYKLGGSGSKLGLPTSHEEARDAKGGRISYFEGGYIVWFQLPKGSIARAFATIDGIDSVIGEWNLG